MLHHNVELIYLNLCDRPYDHETSRSIMLELFPIEIFGLLGSCLTFNNQNLRIPHLIVELQISAA